MNQKCSQHFIENKKKIEQSFFYIIAKKESSQITVKEICELSDIIRNYTIHLTIEKNRYLILTIFPHYDFLQYLIYLCNVNRFFQMAVHTGMECLRYIFCKCIGSHRINRNSFSIRMC